MGHGPSAYTVDGSWLDSQTVVRLKKPKVFPGTRTDYYCARHIDWRQEGAPFWLFKAWSRNTPKDVWVADTTRWETLYKRFSHKKPSTGMCAIFCAVERLNPDRIGLVGFDAMFNDEENRSHDFKAEHECALSLVELVNCG